MQLPLLGYVIISALQVPCAYNVSSLSLKMVCLYNKCN